MSESFNGVEPGTNGKENTKLPIGTMMVDAMTSTLAEPNLSHKKSSTAMRGTTRRKTDILDTFAHLRINITKMLKQTLNAKNILT